LSEVSSVIADSAGNIYIADTFHNRVRRVDHVTGIITTVAGNGTAGYSGDGGQATAAELSSPRDIQVNSLGDLFIADGGNNCVREVNHATGVITTIAGNGTAGHTGDGGNAVTAELSDPYGLALDSAGNLFIADADNSCVRDVNLST
jgi:hypothetical protein